MSGIGFWELIILFLIGLIVLGPERLPRVANQLGTWLGQARRMTRVMRRQLEEEIDFEKDLNIKPAKDKNKPSYSRPDYVSRNEHDDTYSPAHDNKSAGTDVDDASDKAAPAEDDTRIPAAADATVDTATAVPNSETDAVAADTGKTNPRGAAARSSAKEKTA